ncbi:MAG TPA: hypothetical protein VNK23_09075 [Candidatus Dormibacteraeota bacterium]|nr:hypothetical protein [Candidatus Dormibacteraeota bacterium]
MRLLRAAHLKICEAVDVREESGRIVIAAVRRGEYAPSDLLKGITRENLHEEVNFGSPTGCQAARQITRI